MGTDWKSMVGRQRIYSKEFEDRDDVVLWDVLEIASLQTLKITFISKNSPHRQGVRVAIDAGQGEIVVNDQRAKGIELWYDTAPRETLLTCMTTDGLVSVYNIWDKGRGTQSQM
jgi:hypothetical protein